MEYKTTDTSLTAVADAIRTKGGTTADLEWPDEYVTAIENIPTGINILGQLVSKNVGDNNIQRGDFVQYYQQGEIDYGNITDLQDSTATSGNISFGILSDGNYIKFNYANKKIDIYDRDFNLLSSTSYNPSASSFSLDNYTMEYSSYIYGDIIITPGIVYKYNSSTHLLEQIGTIGEQGYYIQCLKVYNNYIYISALKINQVKLYRYLISDTSVSLNKSGLIVNTSQSNYGHCCNPIGIVSENEIFLGVWYGSTYLIYDVYFGSSVQARTNVSISNMDYTSTSNYELIMLSDYCVFKNNSIGNSYATNQIFNYAIIPANYSSWSSSYQIKRFGGQKVIFGEQSVTLSNNKFLTIVRDNNGYSFYTLQLQNNEISIIETKQFDEFQGDVASSNSFILNSLSNTSSKTNIDNSFIICGFVQPEAYVGVHTRICKAYIIGQDIVKLYHDKIYGVSNENSANKTSIQIWVPYGG